MCVIIYKPVGIDMPSIEVLNAARRANPDGCGFVSTRFYKRTMNYKAFLCALSKVGKDEACIIHFRLATHGSCKTSNCHPFRREDVFFAHNGMLNVKTKADMTDSETVFNNWIYPAILNYGWHSRTTADIVEQLRGASKFAMMRKGDRGALLYGDFILENDGCYYSNLRFKHFINYPKF